MTEQKFECHIKVADTHDDAITLLAAHTHLSKQKIKQAMQKGAVWLTRGKYTQRLRRAKKVAEYRG